MLQRMGRVVEAPTPTDVKGKTEGILLTIVGEDIILPQKQPPTEPNRSVDDNGELLHQSLPLEGGGPLAVEGVPPANRKPSSP